MKALVIFFSLTLSSAQAASTPSWMNPGSSSGKSQASSTKISSGYSSSATPFSPGSQNISFGLGQVFVMGSTIGKYDDSIGFSLGYNYGVSELFGFDARISYSGHELASFKKLPNTAGIGVGLLSAVTGLRINLNWYDRVIPNGVVGLGFYRPSFSFEPLTAASEKISVSTLLFGIHIGGGVDLQLSDQLYFGALLTFHDMLNSVVPNPLDSNLRLDLGGTFTSMLVRVGYTF